MQARSPIDTVMPGRRGGISPYVSYVVERKEFCEKLFQSQKPPVLSSSAREKVRCVYWHKKLFNGHTYLCSIPSNHCTQCSLHV